MADFSLLSDTDESAVDEILAEAMDDCVLKQIAAINCSSFSHSVLPSHLESRFQRLKTFPSSSKPRTQLGPDLDTELKDSAQSPRQENPDSGYVSSPSDSSKSSSGHAKFPNLRAKSGDGKVKEGKSPSGYVSSPSDYSNSSSGHAKFPNLKVKSGDGKVKEGKSPSGSVSFGSNAAKSGCFWCSPKRFSRKKSGKKDEVAQLGLDWGKHDEILSDLKSFSSKEQTKIMKVAMKEEEKINKEAEKIVKWAKQASARLDFSVIDYELSDDDSGHNSGLH